jgi:hypothetical protein
MTRDCFGDQSTEEIPYNSSLIKRAWKYGHDYTGSWQYSMAKVCTSIQVNEISDYIRTKNFLTIPVSAFQEIFCSMEPAKIVYFFAWICKIFCVLQLTLFERTCYCSNVSLHCAWDQFVTVPPKCGVQSPDTAFFRLFSLRIRTDQLNRH